MTSLDCILLVVLLLAVLAFLLAGHRIGLRTGHVAGMAERNRLEAERNTLRRQVEHLTLESAYYRDAWHTEQLNNSNLERFPL